MMMMMMMMKSHFYSRGIPIVYSHSHHIPKQAQQNNEV